MDLRTFQALRQIAVVAAIALSIGCSEPNSAAASSDVVGVVDAGADQSGGHDADDGTSDATPDATASDVTADAADGGPKDAATAPDATLDCPGGAGCPCDEPGDCDSGACIGTVDGSVCAKPCALSCEAGWTCALLGGGADAATFCVPSWGLLCRPCDASSQCAAAGIKDPACVRYGAEQGAFCGASCSADTDCPADYACMQAERVEGGTSKQCVRKAAGGDSGPGTCPCGAEAVATAQGTDCKLDVAKAGTATIQRCAGRRTCTAAGLSPCVALQGEAASCVDVSCEGKPAGADCGAGNPCEEATCSASGECVVTLTCACTQTADCAAAEDGNPCTGTLFCDKSALPWTCAPNPATVPQCSTAGDTDCNKTSCDPADGSCSKQAVADKTPCDDGETCTTGDHCTAGACSAGTWTCTCGADADCVGADDGDLCNGTMFCDLSKGQCALNPATVVKCPTAGDTACSQAACVPSSGACAQQPAADGTACDDGDLCTVGEACKAGACEVADLANVCTCTADGDCGAYEDGDACNGTLFCDLAAGHCELNGATVVSCPEAGNTACAKNTCDKGTGACALLPVQEGKACDDGKACTVGDVCSGGACSGKVVCACASDADCASEEDGDLCNGTLFCNQQKGACEVNPVTVVSCPSIGETSCRKQLCDAATGACSLQPLGDGTPCDDGGVCAAAAGCVAGVCAATKQVICDDGNTCTDDACDAKAGCVSLPNAATCPDADACTEDELCKGGTCTSKAVDCDDGNGCTLDGCDLAVGCTHTAADASVSCDDGDACTKGDACGGGSCQAGAAVSCDDGKACTVDSCDAKTGCSNVASDAACDDGNACTDDSCDAKAGCQHSPNTAACSDGSVCTLGDVCAGGTCKAGTAKNCSDDVNCTDDSCDAKSGCKHTVNVGKCNDNEICTTDTCDPGVGCKHENIAANKYHYCGSVGMTCNGGKCSWPNKPAGMVMVPWPIYFNMGCNTKVDDNCAANEHPAHPVKLNKAYFIDQFEVTASAYKSCVDAGVCSKPSKVKGDSLATYNDPGKENHPINFVNKFQAKKYCGWLQRTLCSEAQWEYAARWNDGRKFPWGNELPGSCDRANDNSCNGKPHAVGKHPKGVSAFGAHDMAGNVMEWVLDDDHVYPSGYQEDPTFIAGDGANRLSRGGSFWDGWQSIRTSTRNSAPASTEHANRGFRCCKVAE
ncbi:MAG: formylglycine-generating enzyme family protein [Deltaproteobacteria bacterium]|nr:formylglycine-generating enzyme family protein [Deltaproteobacteria bacterium]